MEERRKDLVEVLGRIENALEMHQLNAEEHKQHHEYIKSVLEREAKRNEFRKAIIEKTFASLVWSAIVAGAAWIGNFLSTHYKP